MKTIITITLLFAFIGLRAQTEVVDTIFLFGDTIFISNNDKFEKFPVDTLELTINDTIEVLFLCIDTTNYDYESYDIAYFLTGFLFWTKGYVVLNWDEVIFLNTKKQPIRNDLIIYDYIELWATTKRKKDTQGFIRMD
jgi:hypothetical protein